MNRKDNPICCGERMVLIHSYLKDSVIYQAFQCNACFRIVEKSLIPREKEEEK